VTWRPTHSAELLTGASLPAQWLNSPPYVAAPFDGRLQGEPNRFPSVFFLQLFQSRTVEDKWHRILLTGCPSRHTANSVRALNESQNTDSSQWPTLILSSSTTGQLIQWAFLPVRRPSGASTTSRIKKTLKWVLPTDHPRSGLVPSIGRSTSSTIHRCYDALFSLRFSDVDKCDWTSLFQAVFVFTVMINAATACICTYVMFLGSTALKMQDRKTLQESRDLGNVRSEIAVVENCWCKGEGKPHISQLRLAITFLHLLFQLCTPATIVCWMPYITRRFYHVGTSSSYVFKYKVTVYLIKYFSIYFKLFDNI